MQTAAYGGTNLPEVSIVGITNGEEFKKKVRRDYQDITTVLKTYYALKLLEQKKIAKRGGMVMSRDEGATTSGNGGRGVTVRLEGKTKGGVEISLDDCSSLEALIQEAAMELDVDRPDKLLRATDEVKVTSLKLVKPGDVLFLTQKKGESGPVAQGT